MALEHRRPFHVVATRWCLVAGAFLAAPAQAEYLDCRPYNIRVDSVDGGDAAASCLGARRAVSFLASQGFSIPGPIAIDLVEEMPDIVGPSALGAYFKQERRILILRYSAFRARSTWFRIPIDREVYRAVVSHEVAHAVASSNFEIAQPSILAQEYIAYVTLFSTIAPSHRNLILGLYPDAGSEGGAQIRDPVVYQVDPIRFGVNAYRHYRNPGNGRNFLREILSGAALAE